MKILVDTNVLVYAYDPADAERQEKAIEILSQLRLSGSGRISVQSLAEFFSAITRPKKNAPPRLTPREAFEAVSQLAAQFEIYPVTTFIVLEAGRGVRDHQLSYYDAQIWAAARLNQTTVIFTEDFPSSQVLEGVGYVNPFDPGCNLSEWF